MRGVPDGFDIAPETLSRWETGAKSPVALLVWVTVAAMVLDKLEGRATTAKQLRAARDGAATAQPVALEVRGAA